MLAIHDRMPVVIPPESFAVWLDPEIHDPGKLARLLRPFHPDEMTAYPVSTLVNSVKNDSPELLAPLPPAEKQARLFSPESAT
jgi:putative SOS response-associated peptidase YedK